MKHYVLLILLLSASHLRSQSFEVGVYGGVDYYDGDLAPNSLELYFQTIHPAGGVFMRANIVRWLSFRLGFNHMTISGDDALSGRIRGLSFETDINEIALTGELNLFRWHLFNTAFYAEPYLLGGVGMYHFQPTTQYEGRTILLQPIGTEGQGLPGYMDPYELWQWNLIGGGGVKIPLGRKFIMGFEASGRINFTDYLDDVSSTVVVYQDILEGNGELAARLSRPQLDPETGNTNAKYFRGGPARDYVITVGVTLSYLFGPDGGTDGGKGIPCPTF